MISSRRLAREWALKIVYQTDVGHAPRAEARDTALERLRLEFVQKGSRVASGSRDEQRCLELATCELRETLPTLRRAFERALTTTVARLLNEAPYWAELLFEKSFRYYAPGVPLVPLRLQTPLSDAHLLAGLTPGVPPLDATLTPEEKATLRIFITNLREHLPPRLDKELRNEARAFAKTLAHERPLGGAPDALQEWLRAHREQHNAALAEHWHKVGQVVQKQAGDWLRTAAFTYKLVEGAAAHQTEVDAAIETLSSGWRLERQVAVDRSILRLAGFEMLFLPGVPAGASINEAVELAKKYSTAESGRFVNGVLGALALQVGDKTNAVAHDDIEAGDENDVLDLPDLSAVEDTDDAEELHEEEADETDEDGEEANATGREEGR